MILSHCTSRAFSTNAVTLTKTIRGNFCSRLIFHCLPNFGYAGLKVTSLIFRGNNKNYRTPIFGLFELDLPTCSMDWCHSARRGGELRVCLWRHCTDFRPTPRNAVVTRGRVYRFDIFPTHSANAGHDLFISTSSIPGVHHHRNTSTEKIYHKTTDLGKFQRQVSGISHFGQRWIYLNSASLT